jgi:hypothetical protein
MGIQTTHPNYPNRNRKKDLDISTKVKQARATTSKPKPSKLSKRREKTFACDAQAGMRSRSKKVAPKRQASLKILYRKI